jgi:hypothetical protein
MLKDGESERGDTVPAAAGAHLFLTASTSGQHRIATIATQASASRVDSLVTSSCHPTPLAEAPPVALVPPPPEWTEEGGDGAGAGEGVGDGVGDGVGNGVGDAGLLPDDTAVTSMPLAWSVLLNAAVPLSTALW